MVAQKVRQAILLRFAPNFFVFLVAFCSAMSRQGWLLLRESFENDWNMWKSLRCFSELKSLNWWDIWREGCAPTQQVHPQSFCLSALSSSESNGRLSLEKRRRLSDDIFFVGSEETSVLYDQIWYIKFSATLLASSFSILPLAVMLALSFQNVGGAISSLLVCLTSFNHWSETSGIVLATGWAIDSL